jgi:hypothetical protein
MFERIPAELNAIVDLLFEAREIMTMPNASSFPHAKPDVIPEELFSPPLPEVSALDVPTPLPSVHACV